MVMPITIFKKIAAKKAEYSLCEWGGKLSREEYMSNEFDKEESNIEHLQNEKNDLLEEIADLNKEALIDAGLDPDDPELADKLNNMEPEELENLWPDTSYQEERIAEIDEELEELTKDENNSEE